MVASAFRVFAAQLRRMHHKRGRTALTLALWVGACNTYEPSLLARGRGGATAGAGGSGAAGAGGAASGAAAPTGSGGARSGTGGTDVSDTTGGTSDEEAGAGGQAGAGDRGGAGTTDTGGTKGLAGAVGAGGVSSAGSSASGSGGTANGGTGTGGSEKGGSTTGGTTSSGGAETTGGTTGSGGTASGGSAGTAGASETCSGCARLSVPLAKSTDRAHFAILLPSKTDLADATITLRMARRTGTGGTILGYVQAGGPDYLLAFSAPIKIDSLGTSPQDIVWTVGDTGGEADTTAIERIGIEIVGTGGGPFSNPTVIYVDRIDVANSSLAMSSWTFDTSSTISSTPTSSGPVGKMWLNNYSADTNVSGAAISWLGP